MATPVPNYYADTSINGEFIGEQEIRLFPLVNSVISSEPLVLISNAAAIPISKSYYLSYDNNELGPVFNKDNIKRNEILNINITPFIYQTASKLVSKYYLPYDNGEIGPVSDKSGVYRNEILTLNNQDAYRYLVQDSSGSNYPIDNRYDQYYKNTKVVLNFDSLSNQAFTNLSLLSSGSFVINTGPTVNTSSFISNSIQVLVVAGGGGGGSDMGGGGGAGGVIYNNSYTITSGSVINVTVGNGGSGAAAGVGQARGTNGNNSVFGSLTAIGGGGGASCHDRSTSPAGNGGSGGGASGGGTLPSGGTGGGGYGGGIRGLGTSGQGYDGGTGIYAWYPGGGGGAGGPGKNNPATGGDGLLFALMSPYYFGGGGGGSGYSGIGGNGGIGGGGGGAVGTTTGGAGLNNGSPGGGGSINSQTNTPGGNAGANTGGGGGGGSHYSSNNYGGNGGSGIVIVRYYGSQKATGGTVTSIDGNTIHTFTGSATMSFYDNPITDPTSVGFFDGSGSYVRISGSSLLNLGSGSVFESPFTVEYDFYTLSASKYQSILSRGAGSINYNTSSGLVYNAGISSSKIIWEYYTNNTSSYLLTGSTNIMDNTWYSYAVTYDGNITRLYLNGVLENSVSNSIYNYPSTLLSSLTSSFIGRLVDTSSNDFSGYLDKFRITTGIARYTSTTYVVQSSSYPISAGVLIGVNYCNSNILNIRFVSGSISASNLILPTGSNDLTSSQDILVTNITKSADNGYLNNLDSGSNLIKGTDGIVNKTIYTGDLYFSDVSINTEGLIKRTILRGSNTTITTNTSEFIPTVNKTYTYEVDYNYMFNQEIDSVLTIDTAYDLPTGFNISTNGKNIVGYVNFTDTKTVIVKLSDGTIYNIIIKPIFFKRKYIY